jgi:Domain of unknown function (DUF2017)
MAIWNPKAPIERVRSGYRINLADEERELLQGLFEQLRAMLLGSNDDPALKRIFPAAYHQTQHQEHDAEYQRLMREELVASRLTGLATVEEALLTKPPLTEEQVLAFMQALNGLRLVLGTVLDVSEELDLDDVADDDPHVGEYHLYNFLSWLLEWTVRALRGT